MTAPTELGPAQVGWPFVVRYALAYMSLGLMLIAPLVVTLALKIRTLVPDDEAAGALALVTGVGGLLTVFAAPVFGALSDRTTSRHGMRRPWMLGGLLGGCAGIALVATAPTVVVVLVGWCLAQLAFNAAQAALVAVLPDQVPVHQRGSVSGVLGVCVPVASVGGTFFVQLFAPSQPAMFLAPCAVGGALMLLFIATLEDRHLPATAPPSRGGATRVAGPKSSSWRAALGAFTLNPRRSPDFAWAFASRFAFLFAYALLTTYQAYYLINRLGTAEGDVPQQVFTATLVQSTVLVAASLLAGRLSDGTGKRKAFVITAAALYALALFVIAAATTLTAFLVGMAVSGLGFGMYMAVDLALVADVLPDPDDAARDLGVFNIANALPYALAPALAPAVLGVTGDSYAVLYALAGCAAVLGAAAIVPIRTVR